MTTTTYTVTGMTCAHCVAAVSEAVAKLPGVTDVRVDLPSGGVTVSATHEVERDELAAAVDQAGYTLA